MSDDLRPFMSRLVDYAGLFPPAALDMAAAVAEYRRHLEEPEAWMLGRFIVPAVRLDELAAAAAEHWPPQRPWALSVLLGDRQDPQRSLADLPDLARKVADFEAAREGSVAVEVLEVPLPAQLEATAAPEFLDRFAALLGAAHLGAREVFFEIPPSSAAALEAPLLDALAAAADRLAGPDGLLSRLGVKLRCGGVTPEAFPSVERVARIIALARDRSLPFKGTAGLHHPVRFQAHTPPVMMHGFFNVFGAGLLAHTLGWDADRLAEVVAEVEPSAFRFAGGDFHWRDHRVPGEDVARLRQDFLCGFGSCSFIEPREDLQTLGLLA